VVVEVISLEEIVVVVVLGKEVMSSANLVVTVVLLWLVDVIDTAIVAVHLWYFALYLHRHSCW
jgi:hypothetical protein